MDELTNSFIQVSSDLSIVDLDVPFGLMFVAGVSINAYRNLVVLAVVTWKVLFVVLLFVVNTAHVFRPSISTEYMFMLYMLFIYFFILRIMKITTAMRECDLQSSNLILCIDFTKKQ